MKERIFQSPPKINLSLAIGATRPDGFHEICSLFHRIDVNEMADTLTFTPTNNQTGEIQLTGPFDCSQENNLIYKSAKLFQEKAGYNQGMRIDVKKEIPAGGGVGGGSSNASTTLFALNEIAGYPLTNEELEEIGLSLGSDVLFFVKGGDTALVTGRGEKVKLLPTRRDLHFKIVVPPFSIATGWAFSQFDKAHPSPPPFSEKQIAHIEEQWCNVPPKEWTFYNDFYPLLKKDYPLLSEIEEDLYKQGAHFVTLSGSGSCMVGVFSRFQE